MKTVNIEIGGSDGCNNATTHVSSVAEVQQPVTAKAYHIAPALFGRVAQHPCYSKVRKNAVFKLLKTRCVLFRANASL